MAKKKVATWGPVYQNTLVLVGTMLGISVLLSWISSRFSNVNSWLSFFVVLVFAASLFWLAWRVLRAERPPRWILFLIVGAALLRLFLSVVWMFALPSLGYDSSEVQQAGYVMEDAYNRDRAAWDLAHSNEPLTEAFRGASSTDQYGGLLFISSAIYRYLGGQDHQPLMVLVLSATFSGLAVAFTWAFSRRVWGDKVAFFAAWGLALYPEAVLLGSSQMREAFTVCLVPLALYGLLRVREKANLGTMALLAIPVVVSIPLTWAFTPSLIFILVVSYLSLEKWRWLRDPRVWLGLLAIALLAGLIFFVFMDGEGLWLVQSAKWQAYVSENASGWIARQFERLPVFAQIPFLVLYGISRPLLPAALVATGPPIWMAIGIWRALGWTLLLAFLLYASFLALRSREWQRMPGALLLSSWVLSFTASYRGGGDLWDSPRYRSAFAAIQVALAAWAWVRYQETRDPWLRRAIASGLILVIWFIPWYLRRYVTFDWPIVELYQVVGLGLVSSLLYIFWDWMQTES